MTKAELVEKIHAKAGLPTKAKAEEALDAVVAALREALASGESVTFTGFGSFKVVERAARKGRNPRTGKEITIPASKVAKFPPGKGLTDAIKEYFAQRIRRRPLLEGAAFFMVRRALRQLALCAPGPKVLYASGCSDGQALRRGPTARRRSTAQGHGPCTQGWRRRRRGLLRTEGWQSG